MQKTCCQRAEIIVTNGDITRITDHSGTRAFWEYRAPQDPAYLDDDPADPDWKRLTTRPDGARRVLKRKPSGDCGFLGEAGCVLPETVRPLVCRLYPWTYTEKGLDGEDPDYCPVSTLAPGGRSMLTVLNMKRQEAEQWRSRLYAELRAGEEPR